jgi:hypothetical protein
MSTNYGPQVVPAGGGFTYDVAGQHAEGQDRDSLVQSLIDYRVANRLAIGNPERDVDQHLIERSGGAYHPPMSAGSIPERKDAPKTLLDRVKSWLINRKYGKVPIKYVLRNEAERRARICLACPKNIQWRSSCAPCVRAVEYDAVIVGANRMTSAHDNLLACAVSGHDNGVAVWLDQTSLKHRKPFLPKLPKRCWLRQL